MGNWFARALSVHFKVFDIMRIWSAPRINFETFDLMSIGLMLFPIIYFVLITIKTGLKMRFSSTDSKTMKKLVCANIKLELLSTVKYWGYYAAILYIIFYQSDLSSIFRYSIPLFQSTGFQPRSMLGAVT